MLSTLLQVLSCFQTQTVCKAVVPFNGQDIMDCWQRSCSHLTKVIPHYCMQQERPMSQATSTGASDHIIAHTSCCNPGTGHQHPRTPSEWQQNEHVPAFLPFAPSPKTRERVRTFDLSYPVPPSWRLNEGPTETMVCWTPCNKEGAKLAGLVTSTPLSKLSWPGLWSLKVVCKAVVSRAAATT